VRLRPGDEFRDSSPSAPGGRDRPCYLVTGVVCETPWVGLYEGKKVFTNYHFGKRKLEETNDEESLDILLKTLQYPQLDDRKYVNDRRDHADFEAARVLGRMRRRADEASAGGRVLGRPLSNLLPEPLDRLQVPNDRDEFAISNARMLLQFERILVLERVHGLPLDRWLKEARPAPARALRVLAHLLDFVGVCHLEGLLLNGPGPGSVWVGEDDRLHYMGSEMMLDAGQQHKHRGLFPPERYPEGFAAPELFAAAPVSGAGDLYGWAALAYYLLTGDSPDEIARRQGQPFATFEDRHFDKLAHALRAVPPAALGRLQREFRVAGPRFAHTWPDGFVAALRECLAPRPERRPASCEALGKLWSQARPRPVPAALAVHLGRHVEVLLAAREMEPGLEVSVRRGAGFLPQTPQQGQPVHDGPLVSRAIDRHPQPDRVGPGKSTPAPPPVYAVFTRLPTDGEPISSPATEAPLLDLAQPAALAQFAEGLAAGEPVPEALEEPPPVPAAVALLEELADATPVARAWLASPSPLIRRWAVHLLQGQLRARETSEPALDLLIELARADERDDLRRAALRAVFRHKGDAEVVERVAWALGGDVEPALRAARGLAGLGPGPEAITAAVARLERERVVACPECAEPVRLSRQHEHLLQRHGYVDVSGSLLSFADALRLLWRRLLAEQDGPASAQLAGLFVERQGERAAAAYTNAFEQQLALYAEALGPPGTEAEPGAAWERLARCLAAHELTRRVCEGLLTHPDARLRRLARLALLPGAARRLGRAGAAAFRRALEALCPREDVQTKLAVCARLQAAGAVKRAGGAVARELELDLESPCPHCGEPVRRRDEAAHLRSRHGIYEVAGERLSWEEALGRLLEHALADRPAAGAARAYAGVAGDRLDEEGVAARLAGDLLQASRGLGRVPPLGGVAGLPVASAACRRLAEDGQSAPVALALFTAIGPRASLSLMEKVLPLLGDDGLPPGDRREALAVVLSSRNAEAGTRERGLERFFGGVHDPVVLLGHLDALAARLGKTPALEARRRAARRLPGTCPLCPVTLPFGGLEEHAWQEHRLVADEARWRPVWEVIDDLLERHRRQPDEPALRRAVELAGRDDLLTGRARLAKLARAKGVRHRLLPRARWLDGPRLRALAWAAGVVIVLALLAWLIWG
jgi:hypothetical protein